MTPVTVPVGEKNLLYYNYGNLNAGELILYIFTF
jgi:hypothetical protein